VTEPHRIWVLAEPEPFLLPRLCSSLAHADRLAGVIEISFPASIKERLLHLRRWWSLLGPVDLARVAGCSLLCALRDRILPGDCHSLGKIARRFGVPYVKCRGFDDPSLERCLNTQVGEGLTLVQVGRRVPRRLVERHMFLNKHCSLLPDRPGVFPVFWAILEGDENLGVTIHRMAAKIDAGPIWAQASIAHHRSFFEAHRRLYNLSFDLLQKILQQASLGPLPGCPTNAVPTRRCTWPRKNDRRKFLQIGGRFGSPMSPEKGAEGQQAW
jgi:methionyl-tRNA formyltransferase